MRETTGGAAAAGEAVLGAIRDSGQLPRWSSSRRWVVLAGVLGPTLFAVLLGALFGLFSRDPALGLAYFFVVLLLWVLPRWLGWRLTVVGTSLEHEDGVVSVLDRRGELQRTVDLEAVERLEVRRGDLVPSMNMFGRHTFSTVVACWRDPDAQPTEVVRTYVPFPDDFDAMVAFLREAAVGTDAEVLDVTHSRPGTDTATPAAVTG